MYAVLFSILFLLVILLPVLFLLVGFLLGGALNERYREYVNWNKHEFDKILKENPHPECFDKKGKIIKEDYLNIDFDLDYDPSVDHMGPGEFGEDDDDMDYAFSDD